MPLPTVHIKHSTHNQSSRVLLSAIWLPIWVTQICIWSQYGIKIIIQDVFTHAEEETRLEFCQSKSSKKYSGMQKQHTDLQITSSSTQTCIWPQNYYPNYDFMLCLSFPPTQRHHSEKSCEKHADMQRNHTDLQIVTPRRTQICNRSRSDL